MNPTDREKNPRDSLAEMGLLEHLAELRTLLVRSILSMIVGAIVAYTQYPMVFEVLVAPFHIAFPNESLVGTSPAEAFMLKITVSIFAGLIFAFPFISYELWRFVSPAMYESEKRLAVPFVFFTTICFLAGAYFCYVAVLPITFSFFREEYLSINLEPQIKLSDHLTMTAQLMIAFGVIFELPVLSFLLARLGVLTSQFMRSTMRYSIVLIFVVSAFLTPPDVVSQFLMAGPLMILLGISYCIVKVCERHSQPS